ncbi:MAG: bifunctional UDP-sugar hydrolase/5'-nucleotidase [Halolamina sp.]
MVRLLHYSDLENVFDDAARGARLAGTVRALDGPDALVVGTGDNTAPGVVSMASQGRHALDFFEAVGADVDTFGNHEFDYGPAAVRELVADFPGTWVSANVYREGDRFGAAEGVVPYTVVAVDGARVGFVGATDPATDSINPQAADLTFTDPVAAVGDAVEALRAEGVDRVVVCSHLGAADDELAARFDVDAVLGGHVHSVRTEVVDGTVLTRPGVNGEFVLEVDLTAGEVTRHDPDEGDPVPELREALYERKAAAGLTEVVAEVAEPLTRAEADTFGGECRVGNFVADAYRAAAGSDVGLQNAGGIREGDPLAGEVTVADMVSTLPFEEPVVTVELTGAELLDVFREADGARLDFGEPEWWHAHLSGASLVWNEADGELVEARVDGEPVDAEATYAVATAEYILHSDHEFPTIEQRHRVAEHGIQHELLAEHARDGGLDVAVEGRVRFRGGDADDDDEDPTGDDPAGGHAPAE